MDNFIYLYPILAVVRRRMNSNYVIATISVLRGVRMGGFHAIAGTSRLTTFDRRNATSLDPSIKVAKFYMQKKICKDQNGPANAREGGGISFDSICDLVRLQCWNSLEGMTVRLTPSIVIRVLLQNQGNAELPLQLSEWLIKGNFQQNIQITSAMIHILLRTKMLSEARVLMERFILSSKCLLSASDIFRALISAYFGSSVRVALCMLIQTYAQLNMIQEATEIFQQSSSFAFAHDVKFCNMLLKVSSKVQQPDLVIKIFKEMQKRRICLPIYSLNYVVKALHQKSRLPEVYNFIHQMHQTGTIHDTLIYYMLNDGTVYKGGKPQAAKRKRGLTYKRSSYVKLLYWHCKVGKSRIGLRSVKKMVQKGFPSPVDPKHVIRLGHDDEIHESCNDTYQMLERVSVLNESQNASNNFITQIHKKGTVPDGNINNSIYDGPIHKGGKLQTINRKKGLTSKSSKDKLMDQQPKDEKSRTDLKLFEEMIQKGSSPPVPVYKNYVVGLGHGDEIHESYYRACQMLEKCNANSYALNNFIPHMHQTGTVSDGIMDNRLEHGATNRGGKLQAANHKRGLTSKRSVYVKQMYRHIKDGKSKVDLKSFKEMVQKDFHPRASVNKRRNNELCRDDKICGSDNLACRSMERDLGLNASTYAKLILKNLQEGNIQEAVFLMEKMLAKRILPESKIYVPFFTQLCTQGKTETAEDLFHSMLNNGLLGTVSDYNLLIDGYCMEAKMQKALDLQEKLIRRGLSPDIYSFKTLISGLCIQGEMGKAEMLLNRMLEMGLSPVVSIYNNLISGYCHRGELEAAFRIRDKMSLNGVEPDVDTYNALISGVCS